MSDRTDTRTASEVMLPGVPDDPYNPPTCDDMLAWLRERDYVVEIEAFDGTTDITLAMCQQGRGIKWSEFGAPTLHAALEAAVRAVADA